MVKKYIILANSNVGFETPRQLTEINGEPLICRTIRLLKENGIKDIIISSCDERFDNLGATRYKPKFNDYNPNEIKSHWVKAFPEELMNEPVVYLFGDVYYSERAIKIIIEEDNDDILFFCTYNNTSPYYIKHHDEPLAFKVHNFEKFKKHIDILIDMWNKNLTSRRPIAWELYRSINGLDVNEHIMKDKYVAINDESCDIDTKDDIIKLRTILGGKRMIRVEAIEDFSLGEFNKISDIKRKGNNKEGFLFKGDTFICDEEMCEYLSGKNLKGKIVIKVIEVIPNIKEKTKIDEAKEILNYVEEKPKTTKKKKSSKK